LFLTLPDQELPRVVQRAASRLAEVPQPGTSGVARLFHVKARPPDEVITLRRRTNVPVTDGVRLIVLDLPPQASPGQTVPLAAYLLIEDAAQLSNEVRVPYVELLDQSSERRTVTRRSGLDSATWRTGDLLIQQLNLTAPVDLAEDDYELRFGLGSATGDASPPDAEGSSASPDGRPAVRAATLRIRTAP
jgi:hypothetical protein